MLKTIWLSCHKPTLTPVSHSAAAEVSAEAGFDSYTARLLHTWTKNIQELYICQTFNWACCFSSAFLAICGMTEGSATEKVHTAGLGQLGIACQLYARNFFRNCSHIGMQISRNVLHHLTLDSKLSPLCTHMSAQQVGNRSNQRPLF